MFLVTYWSVGRDTDDESSLSRHRRFWRRGLFRAPGGWLGAAGLEGPVAAIFSGMGIFSLGPEMGVGKTGLRTKECDLLHVNADYGCYFSVAGKPLVATLHHSSIDDSLSLVIAFRRFAGITGLS